MPLVQLTIEQKEQALAVMSPGLKFLLEEKNVSEDIIAVIGHQEITQLNIFARIEATELGFRDWTKTDLQIEPTGKGRVQTATLVDAWETARERIKKEAEYDAVARVEGAPREIIKSGHLLLRRSYESVHGETQDAHYPGYRYIESRLDQLEAGELRAEALDEVTSFELELNECDDVKLDFTSAGGLRLKRSKQKGCLPNNTERLRGIYKTMAIHWAVIRLRHPNKTQLSGLNRDVWLDHLEYLLGENILGLKSEDENGNVAAEVSWPCFLRYEHEIRKQAIKWVNNGTCTLVEGLRRARTDAELRMKFLITPLSVNVHRSGASGKRHRSVTPIRGAESDKQLKAGKGGKKDRDHKGGKSGKGDKGKGRKGEQATQWKFNIAKARGTAKLRTDGPNSVEVCFLYNKGGCKRKACTFAHACANCLGKHSIENCPNFA